MGLDEEHGLMDGTDPSDSFIEQLKVCASYPLKAQSVDVLQINITRRCNLCCRHCHVEGSPDRTEELSMDNLNACLRAAAHPGITILDITGGAPEMHTHLEWFLDEAAAMQKRVLVRSNGAIILDDAYRRYLDVYANHGVEVVVSLPNPLQDRTDRMRGTGVFDRIIAALKELNIRGYGSPNT
ncbi:MAG: radical SAM protein, partial [Acidobacteriota bacterium]